MELEARFFGSVLARIPYYYFGGRSALCLCGTVFPVRDFTV